MTPSHPEQLLKKEPLQWGRDFCEDMLAFLQDSEIPAHYKSGYCRHMGRDLLAAQRSMQGKRTPLAGGALVVTEGYTALRSLILHLVAVGMPRTEKVFHDSEMLFLQSKIKFLLTLLNDMRETLEKGIAWPSSIQRGLALMGEKGLAARELPLQLPGRVPLCVYILPYMQEGSPACYLKDIHGILLFKNGAGRTPQVAGENIFLHELGHALFARLVRDQGQNLAGSNRWLLARCLRGAVGRLARDAGQEREDAARLAENFCHVFVRTILAGTPPDLEDLSR